MAVPQILWGTPELLLLLQFSVPSLLCHAKLCQESCLSKHLSDHMIFFSGDP